MINGNTEFRNPPILLSETEILKQVENIGVTFGKSQELNVKGKRSRSNHVEGGDIQWREKSIFFQLLYWEFDLLQHNLDVVHIEKNVCDIMYIHYSMSLLKQRIISMLKKTCMLSIRQDLWPGENGRFLLGLYTMTNANKDKFLSLLKNVTVPDGYSRIFNYPKPSP